MRTTTMAWPVSPSTVRHPPAPGSLGYRLYAALHARGRPGLALWALLLLP